MNTFWVYYLFLFILLTLPYTLAPIIVRFRTSHPASPEFEPVGTGQLPPDVAHNFYRFIYAMSADGFLLVGYFRQLAYMPGVGFFLALLKNPATSDMVYMIEMFANNGITPMRAAQVEFCTDFSDGTEISTNNGQQPSIHKVNSEMKIFRFPDVFNPNLLYRIHRRLCANLAPGVEPVLPTDGMEVFRLSYGTVKEIKKQAEFGYYYLDEQKGVFRPTWKGAYLMTWRLAWPVSSIIKARMKSSARQTIKSLGLAA